MTDLLLALGATAASAVVMYRFCLRPMLRKDTCAPQTDTTGQQLARLRREVAELRERGPTPS